MKKKSIIFKEIKQQLSNFSLNIIIINRDMNLRK